MFNPLGKWCEQRRPAMDILCPKCAEPWDRYNLNIFTRACGACDGSKIQKRRDAVIADSHDDGYTSIALVDQDIHPEICTECVRGKIRCESCKGEGFVGKRRVLVEDSGEDLGIYTSENPETIDCPSCDGEGSVDCSCDGESIYPNCGGCHEKIEGDGRYRDIAVVSNGELYCEDCARESGILSYTEPCEDCKGAGTEEYGGDALESDEVRRFLKGEGCPACRFGVSVECGTCNGHGEIIYHVGNFEPCQECDQNGRIPLSKLPPDERREKAAALFEIYQPSNPGADLDGMAADTEDLINS